MISVLFVCYINVCRSPAAAAILRHLAKEEGIADLMHIESCAVSDDRVGSPPDPIVVEGLNERGVEVSGTAKLFKLAYFKEFDYILAADSQVLNILKYRARTSDERAKLFLMTDFSSSAKGQGVPDPYRHAAALDQMCTILFECCNGLVAHLRRENRLR